MAELHGFDALIVPPTYTVAKAALRGGVATDADLAAMRRYLKLAEELRSCRYFVDEERSMKVTMDKGVTTSWEQTLPSAGSTRDMLAVLRQLFGDGERASFAKVAALLRRLADPSAPQGTELLVVVDAFEQARKGVQDSWDAQPGGAEVQPHPPLNVFLDWMYGEFLHSDPEKAKRIQQLDTEFKLYEWQFHWVAERLAVVFDRFVRIVGSALVALEATE